MSTGARPGGRTARVTEQVLDATVDLMAKGGAGAATFDSVAKASGVSRATLYRKWRDRDDLLRAALVRFAEDSVSIEDSGDLYADVVEFLCAVGRALAQPAGRAIVSAALAAADDDPLRVLADEVLTLRLAALRRRLETAQRAGELPSVHVEFLNTMLVAPVYVHVMRERRPLDRAYAERVATTVLAGVGARVPPLPIGDGVAHRQV